MMQTKNPTEVAPHSPKGKPCGCGCGSGGASDCNCHCHISAEFVQCVPGALPGGLSRARFFDGMFLTQQDLEREQNYWLMKRRLTNRALGQGIVWGLRLHWDATSHRFCLGPGYALDCCGNDLVVECPQEIAEQKLVDLSDPAVLALLSGEHDHKSFGRCPDPAQTDQPSKACIVLQYVECPGNPRPLHRDACHTEGEGCEYSSVRETTRLLLVPLPTPPKSTPLENFCHRIEALKGDAKSVDLFDPTETGLSKTLPMAARLLVENGSTFKEIAVLQPDSTQDSETSFVPSQAPVPGLNYRVSLEPNPGYVFHSASATAGAVAPQVEPFGFDVDLTAATPRITTDQFQITPLLHGSKLRNVKLELQMVPATSSVGPKFVVKTTLSTVETAPACRDFLRDGIFLGDPRCVLKSLILAIVSGWFQGAMTSTEAAKNVWNESRTALAWRIGRVAWKLLFSANLSNAQRGALTGLLRKLFEELCCGFLYPGPRCLDGHHGVYLGCVEISPRGKIVAFDPWEHRRHVLTGPLLTHWGGQFGLAPLDVTVSRLAQWICCVSSTLANKQAEPADIGKAFHAPISHQGAAIYAGTQAEYKEYFKKHGLVEVGGPQGQLTLEEFCLAVLKILAEPDLPATSPRPTGRAIYSVSPDVHLLIPVAASLSTSKPSGGGLNFLDRDLSEFGPTGRAVARDFAVEFATATELSSLTGPENNQRFVPFVDALKQAEIHSVADYLDLGTEAGVKRVGSALLESGEFEKEEDLYVTAEEVFKASEDVVIKVIKPLKDHALKSKRPFLRAHLEDEALLGKVSKETAKNLKRKLSNEQLTTVARKVIERGG